MEERQQAERRRRRWLGTVLAGLALMVLLFMPAAAAHAQTLVKSVEGKVLSTDAAPLAGAIIYLQDEKTNVIRTLIATADGGYRFAQLPSDTDYKIWAEYKGKKSKEHLVSSFDTNRAVTHDFHISQK